MACLRSRVGSLKVGLLASIASGVLIGGYELYAGLVASDGLEQRAHFEKAAARAADTVISVIPGFGVAIQISWSLTNLGLSLLIPNRLAARITSSPGSTIVFLFEYELTGEIPAPLAEAVLGEAIDNVINPVTALNSVLGIPSVAVLP